MKGRMSGRKCKRFLKDLVFDVETWITHVAENSLHHDFRKMLRNARMEKVVTQAIPNLASLESEMSNCGFEMLREQILLSRNCEVKKLEGEELIRTCLPL
jgi:hypothetical protein